FFWAEDYYHTHPYLRDPKFFQNGYSLPDLEENKDYEDSMAIMRDLERISQLLMIVRKYGDGFVGYGFAVTTPRSGLESIYLNRLPLIDKFIDSFEERAKKEIQSTEDRRVKISTLIGDKFYEKPNINSNAITSESQLRFLATIDAHPDRAQAILSLSAPERTCLRHYLAGKTAKQIALETHRSPRTVETHLDIAKQKCHVNSRSKLFEFLAPVREFL
ncbi:unnamed protein product, partial [marine sediment metagenome]